MEGKKTTQEEYQKCVNAVVDYINLHLGEEIDLKSLARISHFSPFYFHRIMKAFLGEPIGTFIVRTRTEAAARLLRYSSTSISDIAYRIGYASPSSFSKIFKQMYGISPTEYRNNKNYVIMKPAIIKPDLELKKEIRELPQRNVIYIRLFGDAAQVLRFGVAYCHSCVAVEHKKGGRLSNQAASSYHGAALAGYVYAGALYQVQYSFGRAGYKAPVSRHERACIYSMETVYILTGRDA